MQLSVPSSIAFCIAYFMLPPYPECGCVNDFTGSVFATVKVSSVDPSSTTMISSKYSLGTCSYALLRRGAQLYAGIIPTIFMFLCCNMGVIIERLSANVNDKCGHHVCCPRESGDQ